MQQVLSNLLMNAIQYGDPAEPITLIADGGESTVTIKVMNFGIPIPANALNTIFEPLIQIPRSRDKPASGPSHSSVGLGLFIVREIVEGHQGTVSVSSSTESGTQFTVELPRK